MLVPGTISNVLAQVIAVWLRVSLVRVMALNIELLGLEQDDRFVRSAVQMISCVD